MSVQHTIVRAKHNDSNRWFITLRQAAQDNRLSFESRGVLWYLLSKPDDWELEPDDLAREGDIGRNKVYNLLKELAAAGYIEKPKKTRGPGGKWAWTSYIVYEESTLPYPQNGDTVTGTRLRGHGNHVTATITRVRGNKQQNTEDKKQKQNTEDKKQKQPPAQEPVIEGGSPKVNGGGSRYQATIEGVFTAFDENVDDEMTPMLKDNIVDGIEEFGPARLLEAIEIAVGANVRTWRYIKGILDNWREDIRRKQTIADAVDAAINAPPDETLKESPLPVNDIHLDNEIFPANDLLKTPRAMWSAAMGQLEAQIDLPSYRAYFRDLTPADFDAPQGIYTILVPDERCRKELARYARTVNRVVKDCAGMPLLIDYKTRDEWKAMHHALD